MSKILVSVKNMPKACVLYEYVVRKMQKKKKKNTKIQTKSMYYRKKHVLARQSSIIESRGLNKNMDQLGLSISFI